MKIDLTRNVNIKLDEGDLKLFEKMLQFAEAHIESTIFAQERLENETLFEDVGMLVSVLREELSLKQYLNSVKK